jgi:TldD protein
MNLSFPDRLYCDVRVEDVTETMLQATLGAWEQIRDRAYVAAFIRLYDGRRWYYASTSDTPAIQREIDRLAAMASGSVGGDPVVALLEANTGEYLEFANGRDIRSTSLEDKRSLLAGYFPLIDDKPYVEMWRANYVDSRVEKTFVSSKGADLRFDYQRAGFRVGFQLANGDDRFRGRFDLASNVFDDLADLADAVREQYEKSVRFLLDSRNVQAGTYPVVLSPEAAGVFAHESFGHKSESDFMLGDEAMKKEWEIGKQVGAPILSIVEDGRMPGVGHVPFDDEGTAARQNYLIRKGTLAGRLHSAVTAASMGEGLTGNARAKDFEFEPIVRMTTTYIEPGTDTFDDLIAGVDEGVLVETINHGSGMSTFTLAPSLAYMIRDGRIAEPIRSSVVTGSVFETLKDIDALGDELELKSFTLGGCGKMEQMPLPVGFGGPWVRVKALKVR